MYCKGFLTAFQFPKECFVSWSPFILCNFISLRLHNDEVEEVEEEGNDTDPDGEVIGWWNYHRGIGIGSGWALFNGDVKLLEDPREEHDEAADAKHNADPTAMVNARRENERS